jgi:hypothetical protein
MERREETPSHVWIGLLTSCSAAAALGVGAVILAVYPDPALDYESPLFPAVRRGIEGMNGWSITFLVLAGFIPACFGRVHPLLVGLATMALFPAMSLAEMVVDPTSHNLWPFEWAMYAVLTVPGIVGALGGRRFRRSIWEPGGAGGKPKGDGPGAAQQGHEADKA